MAKKKETPLLDEQDGPADPKQEAELVEAEVVEPQPEQPEPEPAERAITHIRPATVDSPAQIVTQQWHHITTIAADLWKSGVLPKTLKSPQAVAAVILKGLELGIPPMHAAGALHVIEGKVGMSAELMRALIYQRCPGATITIIESNAERCILEGNRPGQPPMQAQFTMEDAALQKLAGKDNWIKEPADMLYARTTSRLARRLWPDIIMGCYTTEEVSAMRPDEAPQPAADPMQPDAPTRAERAATPEETIPDRVRALWQPYLVKAKEVWPDKTEVELLRTFRAYVSSIAGRDVKEMADWDLNLVVAVEKRIAEDPDPRPLDQREEQL